MLLPPYSPLETLKLVRQFAGLNQIEMAARLGVTQSWLSRMESGIGEITLSHLVALRNDFGVTADQLMDGTVPYLQISSRFNHSLSLPEKYSLGAQFRLLVTFPYIRYAAEKEGEEVVARKISKLGFPPFLLAESQLLVNGRFIADMMDLCNLKSDLSKGEAWNKIAAYTLGEAEFRRILDLNVSSRAPIDAMKRFVDFNQSLERAVQYQLKAAGKSGAELSMKLVNAEGIDPAHWKWMCRHKMETLRRMGQIAWHGDIEVQESGAQGTECTVQMNWTTP